MMMSMYKIGSSGEDVKKIQKRLGLKVDGIFGKNTRAAVIKLQSENGLKADGIVGPKTWNVLFPVKKESMPLPNSNPSAFLNNISVNNTIKSNNIINYRLIVENAIKLISNYQSRGVRYSQSKRKIGIGANFSDCSATVATILIMSNVNLLKSTNTRSMRSEIVARGGKFRKSNPLPADIMMWGGHVTIVTDVTDGFVSFAHMGTSGPRIGRVRLTRNSLDSESTWGAGGFIGFWTIS
jgi:hypothetical protein